MITSGALNTIIQKLNRNASVPFDCDELSKISYQIDIIDYGTVHDLNRHIDIDFISGHFMELHEEQELYQYIFKLCELQKIDAQSELEMVLYQKT